MLPGISRGWNGSANNTSSTTSLSLNISGATDNEWVYAYCSWRSTMSSPGLTGWTTVCSLTAHGGASAGSAMLFRRRKVSGDTTFTLSWTSSTQAVVTLNQWIGLDANSPDENGSIVTCSGSTTFTTNSATPGGTNRWGVAFFDGASGDSSHKQITWGSFTSPLTEIDSVFNPNTALAWYTIDCCDTNGVIPVASTSYSAVSSTGGANATNGAATILFLIPAQTAFQASPTLQAVNRTAVM